MDHLEEFKQIQESLVQIAARSLNAVGLVRKPVEVEHLKGELIRVLAA